MEYNMKYKPLTINEVISFMTLVSFSIFHVSFQYLRKLMA